jgi:hypothetical protein
MTLGIFRFFLGKLASHGSQIFGRLPFWYIALVLYFSIFALPVGMLAIPLQWHALQAGGSAPMYVASLPCVLALAMAAADAISKNYVEV